MLTDGTVFTSCTGWIAGTDDGFRGVGLTARVGLLVTGAFGWLFYVDLDSSILWAGGLEIDWLEACVWLSEGFDEASKFVFFELLVAGGLIRVFTAWFEDICGEDCTDVEVDEEIGVEICVEVVVAVCVDEACDGVNRLVLTTILEKSRTGGKLGSVGPGPIIGGLFTFLFDDWVEDPDKLDVWDEVETVEEGEGVVGNFEVEGEFVEDEPESGFEVSIFLT